MSLKPNAIAMKAAIETASKNQTPFGAALAMGDEVFATAFCPIDQQHELSAHAPAKVIEMLSEQIQAKDLLGFTLYATCEPCPACMYRIVESRIGAVVYGCDTSVVSEYQDSIDKPATQIISEISTDVELHANFMEAECRSLLQK